MSRWSTRLGGRTVRRQYAVLSAVMTYALDTDRIIRSPCRRVRIAEPGPVRHMAITAEQVRSLAVATGTDNAPMVYLAAVLGLRWGECAGLRVGDINFLGKTVAVESQLTRGMGGHMVVGSPKWNSFRTMAAPEELLDLLAAHLRRRELTGAESERLVFGAPDGGALHYSNWRRRVWLPACRAAELEGFQFKMLRTANATAMIALAVDIKTAQARTGHRRATTLLDIYAKPTAPADRSAAEALGTHFFGGRDGGSSAAPESGEDARAINARWRSKTGRDGETTASSESDRDQGSHVGGASWNRTSDLSIISAAL